VEKRGEHSAERVREILARLYEAPCGSAELDNAVAVALGEIWEEDPHYTHSLDAAARLVPEGWHWSVKNAWEWKRRSWEESEKRWRKEFGKGQLEMSGAIYCAGDNGLPAASVYGPGFEHAGIHTAKYRSLWKSAEGHTPALALCAAALRALIDE